MRNSKKKLPGDYIAGFVDGEGCLHPLRGKKNSDFHLWKRAVKILYKLKRKTYSTEVHQTLINLRKKMRRYKSKRRGDYANYPQT